MTHPQATIHTKLDNTPLITKAKPKAIPNPQSKDLYEAYANEELIFEWQDFDARRPILEFLGMGGDYFSLMGCTSLKIRAILLYQIESYFWDLECADWSDVLYQSYVIKPLEILEIKSKFIHHCAEEYLDSIFELLNLQIIKIPRFFEIYKNNFPNFIYNKNKESLNLVAYSHGGNIVKYASKELK
ncbi:hypothetical protein BBW65_05700 [Helicobacter enhydrae]|uniref:Uncharacterized protein n=1 Tax=Helicobacter enhydrae TaxID=222136 RepID=A0A1B1U6B0_9HELI|nr:hypothetical protein BBW65_05700 [Helicobacter enhydrae]